MSAKPIAIYYEHPDWFRPLFAEMDRQGVDYVKLHAPAHFHDPALRKSPFGLVVNRISAHPSTECDPRLVLYVKEYLAYLDAIGAQVINGHDAFVVGASKARQLDILATLGLRYPRARVIHDPRQAVAAADGLRFPVVVKPNVGGSGRGILRFDSPADLARAVEQRALTLGIDRTGLVQEFLPARGNEIVRVEVMDGEFLYAIKLPISGESFNYCPADGCQVSDPAMEIRAYTPPAAVIEEVKRILAASHADIGGVEYLINADDGEVYYYDINPLSNFVANAPAIVGFDPWPRFVEFILSRAAR